MKKRIALLIAAIIAVSGFAGCSGNNPAQESSAGSATSTVSGTAADEASSEGSAQETTSQESPQQPTSSAPESSAVSSETSAKESKPQSSAVSSETSQKESKPQSSGDSSKSEASKEETASSAQPSKASDETSKQQSEAQTSQESKASQPAQTSTQPKPQPQQSSQPEESSKASQVSQDPQPQVSQPETSTPEAPKEDYDIGGVALYNELFSLENNVTVDISMDKSEIDKLQADYLKYTAKDDNKKSEIYRKANVTIKVGSKSYTIDEVGVRLKGNQSIEPFYANNGKPNIGSFKLSFDETFDDKDEYGSSAKIWTDDSARKARKKRTFATLNEMDVKWNICYDNTNIREIYATKLFESAGVLVQKIGLSQLQINGNNYGLVKIYEVVDNNFLEKRLPEAALGGDLYKCMWSECSNSGSRTGRWRGATYKSDNSYGIQQNSKGIKFNFNLKTNKKTSNHSSLKNFLNVINKSNVTKSELEKVLDVDYYAAFMAASYFAGDPDDIRNNYNNHYVYFRKDTGKAIFIVYDNDRTLGITVGLNKNCATRNPYSSYAATQGSQENPLISKTISHQATPELLYIREKFADQLKKLSQTEMLKSDADFNKMYNLAKSNYESIITPYTRFENQEQDFRFSLDGKAGGGDKENMSFEQFRSQIMETYRTSTP